MKKYLRPRNALMASIAGAFSVVFAIVPTQASLLDFLGVNESAHDAENRLNDILSQNIGVFLDREEKISNNLITQGTNTGNLLAFQSGNEMASLVTTLRAQFSGELDHQLSTVSTTLLPFFVHPQRWEDTSQKLGGQVVDLEDQVYFDLEKLPFKSVELGVRRVKGNVVVAGDSWYDIQLVGPDFGHDTDAATTSFSADLDGKPIPVYDRNADVVTFRVTKDDLNDKFDLEKFRTATLRVSIERTEFGLLRNTFKKLPEPYSIKIALLPDYVGTITVNTTRPTFEWLPKLPRVTLTQAVRSDFAFTYSIPNPSLTADPKAGENLIEDSVTTICEPKLSPARKFSNGAIYFETDPRTQNGYITAKYIGDKHVEATDHIIANNEVFAMFGFRVDMSHRCAEAEHCGVSRAELVANSQAVQADSGGCPLMHAAERQWGTNNTSLVQWVRGTSPADALWHVSAQILTYSQKDFVQDKPQEISVYSSKLTTIDIENSDGTSSEVTFKPTNSKPTQGLLGHDIEGGLRSLDSGILGTRSLRYRYSFKYPGKP